jgi:hypothetical protein
VQKQAERVVKEFVEAEGAAQAKRSARAVG